MGPVLKGVVRVFHVLNLQLQLPDVHVPLVEQLPQPSDLLLLLVELHEQLRTERRKKKRNSTSFKNPEEEKEFPPDEAEPFPYLVLRPWGRAERVAVSVDDSRLAHADRRAVAVLGAVVGQQLVLDVAQLRGGRPALPVFAHLRVRFRYLASRLQ